MKKNGQISLIILLVMVVGLTIGLSLATRSVSDIKNSTQIEESSRAFSAAEAGIESALKGEPAPTPGVYVPISNNARYTFATAQAGGSAGSLDLGNVGIADTYTIWLTSHNLTTGVLEVGKAYDYDGTSIDVCWKKTGTGDEPAMEMTLVYQDISGYQVSRAAFDPSGRPNNFAATSSKDCGLGFSYGVTFPLDQAKVLIALRIRPFYAAADIAVAPAAGIDLRSQGVSITSIGTAGGTTRKVEVIQSYPSLPAIFDYVLFSGTGVSKP